MASRLYEAAVATLDVGQRAAWDAAAIALPGINVRPTDRSTKRSLNKDGAQVLANLQTEEHLGVDASGQDPHRLAQILAELGGAAWTGRADEQVTAFCAVCDHHVLQGPQLVSHPPRLWRYVESGRFCDGVVRRLNSDPATVPLGSQLQRRMNRADKNKAEWYEVGVWLIDRWAALPLADLSMSGSTATFVSFDTTTPLARTDVDVVYRSLALWAPAPVCYIELGFEPAPGDTIRIPTCADCGFYSPFRPAPFGEPHGWTAPRRTMRGTAAERQPEAVLPRPSLSRVTNAARNLRVLL